jgi:hypothetical protein
MNYLYFLFLAGTEVLKIEPGCSSTVRKQFWSILNERKELQLELWEEMIG